MSEITEDSECGVCKSKLLDHESVTASSWKSKVAFCCSCAKVPGVKKCMKEDGLSMQRWTCNDCEETVMQVNGEGAAEEEALEMMTEMRGMMARIEEKVGKIEVKVGEVDGRVMAVEKMVEGLTVEKPKFEALEKVKVQLEMEKGEAEKEKKLGEKIDDSFSEVKNTLVGMKADLQFVNGECMEIKKYVKRVSLGGSSGAEAEVVVESESSDEEGEEEVASFEGGGVKSGKWGRDVVLWGDSQVRRLCEAVPVKGTGMETRTTSKNVDFLVTDWNAEEEGLAEKKLVIMMVSANDYSDQFSKVEGNEVVQQKIRDRNEETGERLSKEMVECIKEKAVGSREVMVVLPGSRIVGGKGLVDMTQFNSRVKDGIEGNENVKGIVDVNKLMEGRVDEWTVADKIHYSASCCKEVFNYERPMDEGSGYRKVFFILISQKCKKIKVKIILKKK